MELILMSIPTILDILLDFSLVAILLFLAIKTKSKGITLIFIVKTIDKITIAIIGSFIIKNAEKGLPFPKILEIMQDIQGISISALYLLGVYMIYREWRVNKFSTAQSIHPIDVQEK